MSSERLKAVIVAVHALDQSVVDKSQFKLNQ